MRGQQRFLVSSAHPAVATSISPTAAWAASKAASAFPLPVISDSIRDPPSLFSAHLESGLSVTKPRIASIEGL
jgi:hypothetical protein